MVLRCKPLPTCPSCSNSVGIKRYGHQSRMHLYVQDHGPNPFLCSALRWPQSHFPLGLQRPCSAWTAEWIGLAKLHLPIHSDVRGRAAALGQGGPGCSLQGLPSGPAPWPSELGWFSESLVPRGAEGHNFHLYTPICPPTTGPQLLRAPTLGLVWFAVVSGTGASVFSPGPDARGASEPTRKWGDKEPQEGKDALGPDSLGALLTCP